MLSCNTLEDSPEKSSIEDDFDYVGHWCSQSCFTFRGWMYNEKSCRKRLCFDSAYRVVDNTFTCLQTIKNIYV